MVSCKLVTVYTNILSEAPSEALLPVINGLDHFFEYGKQAISITGESIDTPNPQGMSGSAVWKLGRASGIWDAKRSVHVVGIQSSSIPSKYIRCKSWQAVVKLLSCAGYDYGQNIEDHVEET